ncbi:ABC transporter [Devosia limi DSM 17137]|uniref:ABC transporter n=1 Tax=Devosia limi DSM 17137 TaxID=1121477 RepID=A0A0F5LUR1_9HYPH|nr:ABC transporter ATP-binding protein [Devosia limi]KKB86100.1 ABC transporter [Devosia limi DSM 17137]SHF85185.1 simple sugar transport system ATP-binding protein [Devosia limi DSM 17137]
MSLPPLAQPQYSQGEPLLRLEGVSKKFGTLVANCDVDLSIHPSEIVAVLGENGAGKSTLMKMIFGVMQPSAGSIYWRGQRVQISSPAQARQLGIGMVFQHFTLFETITVAENVALSMPGTPQELAGKIREASQKFGLAVEPHAPVYSLSVGERQRVELLRCLLQDPSLLILDEPTSVLPPTAIESLFQTLRGLQERGIAILYISHKLEEIRALCQRATILRHGRVTGTVVPKDETAHRLAELMIGREIPRSSHPKATPGEVVLKVSGLSVQEADPLAVGLKNVSFDLREGEILGIAGVSGNGQRTLARALSGEDTLPPSGQGSIEMLGRPVGHLGAAERRALRLAFVPEERMGRGAAPTMALRENALLTAHGEGMVRRGMIQREKQEAFTLKCIADMDVRSSGPAAPASTLSGGNLQKFIVGREMMLRPRVFVVSQPTWGIDVGAAALVRQKLVDMRGQGSGIIVISEELEELFEVADRIAVMFDGRLSPSRSTALTTPEIIGQMMIGLFDAGLDTAREAAQ